MLTSSRGIRVGVILINYPLYMLKEYLVFKNVASLQFSQLALISFLLNAPMVSAFIIEDYCGKKGKISSIDSVFRLSTLILLCSVSYQFLNIPVAVKTKFQIVYFIWLLLFPLLNILSYKIEYASVKNLLELSYLFAVTCFFYYGFPVFKSFSQAMNNIFRVEILTSLILWVIVAAICLCVLWYLNELQHFNPFERLLGRGGTDNRNGSEGERPVLPTPLQPGGSEVEGEDSYDEEDLPPLVPYSPHTAGGSEVEGEDSYLEGASVPGFNLV